MAEIQLGRMQFRIMQVLWDQGKASARAITDALSETEAVSHSTVQTLLRQMEAKGAIKHEAEGRTFVFVPLILEDRVKRSAVHDLLDRVFGGNVGALVTHLLKAERLTRAEIDELHRLIDDRRDAAE